MENMECIPCKLSMNIDYTNLYIGKVSSVAQLFSETKGDLLILIENEMIFSEKEILLLELVKEIIDWLNNYQVDFEYYSMDYEEGPILFF